MPVPCLHLQAAPSSMASKTSAAMSSPHTRPSILEVGMAVEHKKLNRQHKAHGCHVSCMLSCIRGAMTNSTDQRARSLWSCFTWPFGVERRHFPPYWQIKLSRPIISHAGMCIEMQIGAYAKIDCAWLYLASANRLT